MPVQARSFGFARLQEWRFLQLTIALALWMLLSPRLSNSGLFQLFMQLILLNCMLVTLWISVNKQGRRALLLALWGLSLAASLALLLPVAPDHRVVLGTIEVACRIPILLACATGILLHVFRRGAITTDSIFAAVAAYVLIAFAFAEVYVFVQMWSPESFRFPAAIDANPAPNLAGSLLYFSFVTIATLGYGDILPATDSARMLAMIEAVVGQFYVAVIVALLVSKFIASTEPSSGKAGAASRHIE